MTITMEKFIKRRKAKRKRNKTPALKQCPQRRGIVVRIGEMTPRKPNSAKRKIAVVRLTSGKRPFIFIPGIGHNLGKFSWVLVRGGRVPDLPGVKYKAIRNKEDLERAAGRYKGRSKYGVIRTVGLLQPRRRVFYYGN